MADQQLNEKQLQALLRIKRYEQPPPAYFDGLLSAIQRRQREEMLRRPAWRLFFDRVGAFFASLQKDWSYVGSMVCVIMIGVGVIQIALPRHVPVQTTVNSSARVPYEPLIVTGGFNEPGEVTLDPREVVFPPNESLRPVRTPRAKQRPTFPVHYIYDTQPSNHEPPTRVRF